MPRTLQLRRKTTANLAAITGSVGEIFVDLDKDTLVVMDGSTAGGFPLAKESAVTLANTTMKSYVDGQITAANTSVSSAVTLANTTMKSYVDGQITAANTYVSPITTITNGTSNVSILSAGGNIIANVGSTIVANIGSTSSWFRSNIRAGGILTNNYYYANGAAVSFGGGGGGATISEVSDIYTYYLVGTSSTSGSLSTASINTSIRFNPFISPTLYVGTYTAIRGAYIQTQYLANSTSSSGTAGQVLTSGGYGTDFYWSTPAAGGGGTMAIGNAVYLMWYASSTYYLARGWVYKSNKMTYPSLSTMYFRFYDYYSSPSINPSWSTVKDAPSPSTWSFQGSSPSASSFASTVSYYGFYGLEFYSDYTFAGSEMIMPMSPASTSATPAATLKYPSGGLEVSSALVNSGYDSMTNATWGYAPNYYIYFDYYLDGSQDSKIASFNYP